MGFHNERESEFRKLQNMDRVSEDQIVITVVVPTYNEEWAIFPLWQKLSRVAAMESQFAWHFLFVNDGSTPHW